jgi:lysine 6-dehydrogenase
MSKYVVVGGAGRVAKALAWDLLQSHDTSRVILADCVESLKAVPGQIASPEDIRSDRCTTRYLDVHKSNRDITKLFALGDVIISAVPACHNVDLADIAIETGKDFCDFGGVLEVHQSMHRRLDRKARRASVAVATGCGLMPGLGSMIGKEKHVRRGGAHSILVTVAGLPQCPQPPHFYQNIFSAPGLLEILAPAPVLRDGAIRTLPPFSDMHDLHIPALERFENGFHGEVQACVTAGADTAAWHFQELGIQNFWEETLRWNWDTLKAFIESFPPKDRVQMLEKHLPPTNRENPDLVILRVTAKGRDWAETEEIVDTYDPVLDMSAMARTTGFSAAVIARFLAMNPGFFPGVWGPEELPGDILQNCIGAVSTRLRN